MNFNNVRVPKVPGGGAAYTLLKVGITGGLALYAAANSLYTVEGGHRATEFNRLVGIKDKVFLLPLTLPLKICMKKENEKKKTKKQRGVICNMLVALHYRDCNLFCVM